MASALDAVLQIRAQKQQAKQLQDQQTISLLSQFTQQAEASKQQNLMNQLGFLNTKANLLDKGFDISQGANGLELVQQKSNLIPQIQGDLVPTEFDNRGRPKAFKSLGSEKKLDDQKQLAINQKALDEFIPSADKALTALQGIEELASNLPDFNTKLLPDRGINLTPIPIGAKTVRKIGAKIAESANQKDTVRFQGKLSQELIPLARNLAEEKGPITDKDVERIAKGLGDLSAAPEDRQFLFNELKEKIAEALKAKLKLANVSEEELIKNHPKFEGILSVGKIPEEFQGAVKSGTVKEEALLATIKKFGADLTRTVLREDGLLN